jgi:hypothetical protein
MLRSTKLRSNRCKPQGRLCIGGIVMGRGCVDSGKVCELSVDLYDEVAIR